MEKALLCCVVALAVMGAVHEVGQSLKIFYAKLNCQMAHATVCIIEKN